jgi:2-hydroxy-3-keto-5-methylthiopentenyl-1-phosphate phosphatase
MATAPSPRAILVTDFDGTLTDHDFYRLALAQLVPADTPDFWDDYLAGRLTHFAALAAIFARIRGEAAQVLAVARQMGLDPQAGAAIARLQAAGWEIVIASAGCRWYIDRLLADQAVSVTVHANPGTLDADGLHLQLPTDSPFFSPTTGIDKGAVIRWAVQRAAVVAFAGDGPPDRAGALLVPPERRFARGWLAAQLTQEGLPFQPFPRWAAIADCLLA